MAVIGSSVFIAQEKFYPVHGRMAVCQEWDWLFMTLPQATKTIELSFTYTLQCAVLLDEEILHCSLLMSIHIDILLNAHSGLDDSLWWS